MFAVSFTCTFLCTVLSAIAMFTEFDSSIGYFNNNAVCHMISNGLMWVSVAVLLIGALLFRKREIFPVINYDSSPFRFFSSMSACLSLLMTYVRFQTYMVNVTSSDPMVLRGNIFTLMTTVFSLLSFFVFITYAFGKNEKKSSKRAMFGFVAVGMLGFRLMETHFTWNVQMNNPIKLALQFALVVTVFALIYTFKCEFAINETSPYQRLFFLLLCPIFAITFAVPVIIVYYAKIYTDFSLLADSLVLLSVCGFVLTSYTPCRIAKPLCDADWAEYDLKLEEHKLMKQKETDIDGEMPVQTLDSAAEDVSVPTDTDVEKTDASDIEMISEDTEQGDNTHED